MPKEKKSKLEDTSEFLTESDELTSQLHRLSTELTHFITETEESRNNMLQSQQQTEEHLQDFRKDLEEELEKIDDALKEISEIMSEAGAARWRLAAEQALQEGELHTKILKELVQEFYEQSEKTFARMERVTVDIEKRIAKLFTTLSVEQNDALDNFKNRSEKSYQELDQVASSTLQSFKKSARWFRVERVLVTVVAAFLAALLTGMYLNAEWPWESYYRTAQERQVGQAVLKNWPRLTEPQKSEIDRLLDLQLRE